MTTTLGLEQSMAASAAEKAAQLTTPLLVDQIWAYGHLVQLAGKDHLPGLEARLKALDERLDQSAGFLALGFARPATVSPKHAALEADFGIPSTEEEVAFAIPLNRITAHHTNPQFYAEGEDTKPVLNVRVQSEADLQAEPAGPGRWYQLPLMQVRLDIVS